MIGYLYSSFVYLPVVLFSVPLIYGAGQMHVFMPCQSNQDCLSENCVDKVCMVGRFVGDDCTNNEQCNSYQCENSKCVPGLQDTGDYCENDDMCLEGLMCDKVTAECEAYTEAYKANADSCSTNNECRSTRCVKNICTGNKGNDEDCLYNSECRSYRCRNKMCVRGPYDKGDYCEHSEGCLSGLDCDYKTRQCVKGSSSPQNCRKRTMSCKTQHTACKETADCCRDLYCRSSNKGKICMS